MADKPKNPATIINKRIVVNFHMLRGNYFAAFLFLRRFNFLFALSR